MRIHIKIYENRNEILIELPLTYPLDPAVIRFGQHALESRWNKRIDQLTTFFQSQVIWAYLWWLIILLKLLKINATVCIFKRGSFSKSVEILSVILDNAFKGVTECSICLELLHRIDGSLPRLRCNTCHNRIHARCLHRWLRESEVPTCPLCRSNVQYLQN